MKSVTPVAITAPLMLDMWGYPVPALSLLTGLGSVILIRIMLMSKDFKNDHNFWMYNIPLTLLMVVLTFCLIVDRQFNPGVSAMVGVGIGASGIVLVDILKERVQNIIKAMLGKMDE